MTRTAIALLAALVGGACVSGRPEAHDAALRRTLLDSVKALEGTWESPGPDGKPQVIEFKTSSAGSIVREIMFPGTPTEMTNVYRLDGNALRLTHYCAMGNQPEMRATALEGNRMNFEFGWVADLETPDELYMGGLTLEFVDADHMTEHWTSFAQGKLVPGQSIDIALTRRK